MADLRIQIDIIGASYSSTEGAAVVKRPFPNMAGALRAAYLFGSKYASFAPEALGRALGPRYDWSGSGQHIEEFGRQRVSDYWLEGLVSTQLPTTPFNADTLIGDPDDGITLVAFHHADTDAKSSSIIRSLGGITTSDPYVSLALQPTTTSGRVLALVNNSGAAQSALSPLPDEVGSPAMYAGTYKTASRQVFAKGPGAAIKSGTAETTSKTLESTGGFQMGVEASGSETGTNRLIGCAFYRGVLTESELEDEVYAQFKEFQTAVSSGIAL